MADIEQQPRGRTHSAVMAALEVVPLAMLIADASAQVLAVNGRWTELSRLGPPGSLGPGWLSVLEPDARGRLREDALRVARGGGTVTVDYQILVGAKKRWTRWWIGRHEIDGLPLVAIGAADVDDDYGRQANLYHLATHDSLTGLINRSHFIECIDQALRRSQRQSRLVAVVYVDLDGFKRVNDRGGHSLGDRVLFAIASRLRHAVRGADLVARIGGDEFAVLCEGLTAAEQANTVGRRIASALTESVEVDGERWSVAASVGAAVDRGEPDSAEELVDRADRAMYTIKQTRRDPGGDEHDGPTPGTAPSPPPDQRLPSDVGYAYHTPVPPRPERPPAAAADVSGPEGRLGGFEPAGEARRALRDLADVAGAMERDRTPEPEPATEPGHDNLTADVISLKESIDSIRRMLDRLLTAETGVIDIRESDVR